MVFEKKREQMIRRLRGMGIKDENVLQAMFSVPRHHFVPEAFSFQAYDEKALPIGFEQTISHPYTVARMTELLEVHPGHKILEIGTGSGYQSAVLCMMEAQVFSIERVRQLSEKAKKQFQRLGLTCAVLTANGVYGWEQYAPYDSIIVTAGAPVIPQRLFSQIKSNGRLLIPVGSVDVQRMELYIRSGEEFQKYELGEFQFVPLKALKETENGAGY